MSMERRAAPAQRATSAAVAILRRERGIVRGRRERAVQLGGDRAELPRLGRERITREVAIAVRVRARALERVRPAVHRAGDEAREHSRDGSIAIVIDHEHRVQLGRVAEGRCSR